MKEGIKQAELISHLTPGTICLFLVCSVERYSLLSAFMGSGALILKKLYQNFYKNINKKYE
jgi:hypothetical protein